MDCLLDYRYVMPELWRDYPLTCYTHQLQGITRFWPDIRVELKAVAATVVSNAFSFYIVDYKISILWELLKHFFLVMFQDKFNTWQGSSALKGDVLS